MKRLPNWLPFVLIGALVLLVLLTWPRLGSVVVPEVSYSQFKAMVTRGEVERVALRGDALTATLRETRAVGPQDIPAHEIKTRIPSIGDPDLFPLLEQHGVEVTSLATDETGPAQVFFALLPWIFLIGIYWFFWTRMRRTMGGMFGGRGVDDFLSGSVKKEEKRADKVTFADVAGQDTAKREVAELVAFLKSPEKYRALGAEPPHGILLVGPPGTGKTLMARALAGEAKVPFFHISASEFIEVFVGVGASRVRKMFEEAKRRAPAIIFIDELDAIGRMRGTGLGGGHDEREQTLNQILSEMDGFAGHEAVIVLAATNRPDVLDPALLRPGRFDRHVTLELPDKPARLAILQVHTRKVPLASDVDLAVVAAGTPGFSGADLKNLVNEAAMAAARAGKRSVAMAELDAMRDKLMMGTARTLAIQPEERHRLAVHEAGHTVVAHFLEHADPLYKVTIIPRGRSLGGTHMLPEQERHTLPEDYLRHRLGVLLAGRTAEKIVLGTVSSGADDDIRQATLLARSMVARWGMAEEVGPVDLRQSEEHPFLGREIAQPQHFSPQTAHLVDEAIARLLREAEQQAAAIIGAHRGELETLVDQLERNETLDRQQIDACLGPAHGRQDSRPSADAAE